MMRSRSIGPFIVLFAICEVALLRRNGADMVQCPTAVEVADHSGQKTVANHGKEYIQ